MAGQSPKEDQKNHILDKKDNVYNHPLYVFLDKQFYFLFLRGCGRKLMTLSFLFISFNLHVDITDRGPSRLLNGRLK